MTTEPKENLIGRIPLPGLRTMKTVLAVALAALFMRYVLHQSPFFACIGAVVAMERTLQSSLQAALIRNVATLTGGLVGIAISSFTENILLLSLGLIPLIVVNNKIGRKESIVPGAIVYFAVAYLNTMDQAWFYGLMRILGTFIGTAIGIGVNLFVFPPAGEGEPEAATSGAAPAETSPSKK